MPKFDITISQFTIAIGLVWCDNLYFLLIFSFDFMLITKYLSFVVGHNSSLVHVCMSSAIFIGIYVLTNMSNNKYVFHNPN